MSRTALSRRGFSVRVFLPDGDPDGVKVVEKSNWTGCGLVIPRPLFAGTRGRRELERTGVYVLVGPSESSSLPRAYVGEGDPVLPRLDEHARKKDFWTHAVVFTSNSKSLNKAHVQRLESRLVELAASARRCVLDNGNVPQPPSLSEADTAEVEGFLDDLLLCLPILGYGFFEPAPTEAVAGRELWLKAKGLQSRGFETPNGFTVCKGAQAVKVETRSIHPFLQNLRATLLQQELLVDRGAFYELTQDYVFDAPSTASGVLLGRPSNGRVEWKTADGHTLKSVQGTDAGPVP